MLFYLSAFLFFLYVKIARVYKKEELPSKAMLVQNSIVAISGVSIFFYGFTSLLWWVTLLVAFLFFIVAALMVTAVQLGIFVDGKPRFGISKLYKFLPAFTGVIALLSVIIWL